MPTLRGAHDAVAAARKAHRSAQRAADGETAAETALRSALGRIRDPLVVLGAPAVDQLDIVQGWHLLAQWSGGAHEDRVGGLADARAVAAAAQESASAAERELRTIESAAAESYTAENLATARRERAAIRLTGEETRSAQLAASLAGAPSEVEAHAELARLDVLAAAAAAADAVLRRARQARRDAADAAQASAQRYAAARQALRSTRDDFVALGAPQLSEGSMMVAWSELTDWARTRAEVCATDLAAQRDAAEAATTELERQQAELRADLALLEIPEPPGDLVQHAAAAVAVAVTEAGAQLADLRQAPRPGGPAEHRPGERPRGAAGRAPARHPAALEQVPGVAGARPRWTPWSSTPPRTWTSCPMSSSR